MSMNATDVLSVEDLTVRYGGVVAVDSVTASVGHGEFVGLIGPNGAGKTTFIDAVTGLTSSSGAVKLDGDPIEGLPPHRRTEKGMARTFQSLELFEDLTVMENVLASAEVHRWWSPIVDIARPSGQREARASAEEALDLLGLTDDAGSYPPELSLGKRKLVGVARAIAGRPKLLLLDEPAAGLDSSESVALGRELTQVVAAGTSILMIEHDMGLVMEVCERIHVIEFGRLIASGPTQDIRSDERVIQAYLGASDDDDEIGDTE
jgi:ABC-type branched-subunit amino acid transport system ATPase component